VTNADYEKMSLFIVLEPVKARLIVFFRFTFRTAADDTLFRLRPPPLPRNLLIIFCDEAATCLEIMSVVSVGGFSAIFLILPSVRNASRPRALKSSLPTDLAPLHKIGLRVLNNPAKILPNYVPSV
jgi:hypothetical protein